MAKERKETQAKRKKSKAEKSEAQKRKEQGQKGMKIKRGQDETACQGPRFYHLWSRRARRKHTPAQKHVPVTCQVECMSEESGDTPWRQRAVRVPGNKPLVGLAIKWVTTSRGHPDLNRGPLDLQSNALPLSYAPTCLGLCQKHCKLCGHTCLSAC